MRKVYNLLVLAVMFIASTVAVQAQKRYQVTDIETPATIDELSGGEQFVINSGALAGGGYNFVRGLEATATITEENLFTLEEVGTNSEGLTTYRLKRVSDGTYLQNNDGSLAYNATPSRAWTFCAFEAATVSSDDIENADVVGDYRAATLSTTMDNTYTFADASATVESKYQSFYFLYLYTDATYGVALTKTNYTYNIVNLYTVQEITGSTYLEEALTDIFGEGVDPSTLYNRGDQPGYVPAEQYDELINAYNAAMELINNMSEDNDACVAAAERCEKAYAAAKDAVIPVAEGYYMFRTYRNEKGYTYDDGSKLRWVTNYEIPEEYSANDLRYIWQLTENPDDKGTYYIKNMYTLRYLKNPTGFYEAATTTDTPEESWLIYPASKDFFLIESTYLKAHGGAWGYAGYDFIHSQENGLITVVWNNTEGSWWQFVEVSEEDVLSVLDQVEQLKLNEELKELVSEANDQYHKGFFYSIDESAQSGKLDNAADGSVEGLVTTLEQISTNAQEANEGPMEKILDNLVDETDDEGQHINFFHSSWSSDDFDHTNNYPYLQLDLGKQVEAIGVKMWPRYNNSWYTNNLPGKIHVLATNTPDDDNSWVEIGNFENALTWPMVTVAEDGTETTSDDNLVSYVSVPLYAPYQYVRLEVATRLGSTSDFKGLGISAACFNLSEIRVFEAALDESQSLINSVPEDAKNGLTAAIEKAQAELDAESATQATIDELQAALDYFLENYPDPQLIRDDITEAKAQVEAAVEGEGYGYFQAGAIDEFKAAVEAIEATVKTQMTVAEVKAAREKVAEAFAAFNKKLIVPANGAWVYIVSKTSGAASNAYVYSAGNGVEKNAWRAAGDEYFNNRPEYIWQFIHNADGTYSLKNAANGEYLNVPKEVSGGAGMSTQGDTCTFTMQSAKVEGIMNLVFGESLYMNADPSGPIVAWGSASGTDNSAFTFEDADAESAWDGEYALTVKANTSAIITLPFDVKADGSCYTVLGRNADQLILKAYEKNAKIEGGTPFFYIEEDGESVVTLTTDYSSILEITPATEAKNVNGLQGTLAPISNPHLNYGTLLNNAIVDIDEGDAISNNSGYILPSIATTTETGDAQIKIDGTINAISTVAPAQEATVVSVYTLTGVRVRANVKAANATNGLPAGLYIVGSQKVLVK